MVFAKAKTQNGCTRHPVCAGQGSPDSLASWVAPGQLATTKAETGHQAKRMDNACGLPGFVFPAVCYGISLVGSIVSQTSSLREK